MLPAFTWLIVFRVSFQEKEKVETFYVDVKDMTAHLQRAIVSPRSSSNGIYLYFFAQEGLGPNYQKNIKVFQIEDKVT